MFADQSPTFLPASCPNNCDFQPVVNCSTRDCPVAPFCATMAAIAIMASGYPLMPMDRPWISSLDATVRRCEAAAKRPLLISANNFFCFSSGSRGLVKFKNMCVCVYNII